jgi:hypothetical protein
MNNIINIVAFQAVWLGSVMGAANGITWLGAVLLIPFAVWQLRVSKDPAYDRRAIVLLCIAGALVDSAYPLAGMLGYASPWPSAQLAPAWLVLMWVNLALTLNHSLAWLRGRHLLAAIFGGTGGALSYYAGYRLGAVEVYWSSGVVFGLIGLAWAVALPVLYGLLDRLSQVSTGSVPSPR